jgi:hypothetical protein
MAEIDTLRDQLIEELWLPMAREGGARFYNSRRKNKQMKLFTLTDGINFKEISRLEDNNLVQRGDCVLWVSNMIKAVRAETEALGVVLNGSICDELISTATCQLNPLFPCDILNLDFSSQDIYVNNSRIEKELEKVESFIVLQGQKRSKGFVLLQTTVVNSEDISRDNVKRVSDAMQSSGWGGLALDAFPPTISSNTQKMDLIKKVAELLCQKYKYNIFKISSLSKDINTQQQLYSLAVILVR